jgi:hypothetical protein
MRTVTLLRRTNTLEDQLNHQQSHYARTGLEEEPTCEAVGFSLAGDSDHARPIGLKLTGRLQLSACQSRQIYLSRRFSC